MTSRHRSLGFRTTTASKRSQTRLAWLKSDPAGQQDVAGLERASSKERIRLVPLGGFGFFVVDAVG